MTTRRRFSGPMTAPRFLLSLVLALVVIAAGCGSDGDDDDATDDTTTITSSDDTTDDDSDDDTSGNDTTSDDTDDDTDDDTTSDTTSSDDTDDDDTTDDELPGEPFEGFPSDGDVLAAVGVAYDDVLNVRALPGTDADIVTTAPATTDDLVATGRARSLPESIWYEITYNGVTGWVGSQFVAFMGATEDATAEFLAGGPPIEAETMGDLAQPIVDFYASEDPPSDVVQSVEVAVGDRGEITYDVIGIGDDALAGYRLHIFGLPTGGGQAFVLDSIERTYFCLRGVSEEFCV